MTLDLPLIFTVLMGVAILAYVVLDGYDLGVGMLMPAADAREQDVMVSSIGPFWDANETWLVLGIGLLLVAFPVAHGVVLTALYLPVAAMLIAPDQQCGTHEMLQSRAISAMNNNSAMPPQSATSGWMMSNDRFTICSRADTRPSSTSPPAIAISSDSVSTS